MVEEVACESIWAWSLILRGLLKCLVYFLYCYWLEKGGIFLWGDEGGHMLGDFVDCFMFVCPGFCEEVLKVTYQGIFHIPMGVYHVPVI